MMIYVFIHNFLNVLQYHLFSQRDWILLETRCVFQLLFMYSVGHVQHKSLSSKEAEDHLSEEEKNDNKEIELNSFLITR